MVTWPMTSRDPNERQINTLTNSLTGSPKFVFNELQRVHNAAAQVNVNHYRLSKVRSTFDAHRHGSRICQEVVGRTMASARSAILNGGMGAELTAGSRGWQEESPCRVVKLYCLFLSRSLSVSVVSSEEKWCTGRWWYGHNFHTEKWPKVTDLGLNENLLRGLSWGIATTSPKFWSMVRRGQEHTSYIHWLDTSERIQFRKAVTVHRF